MFRGCSSLQYMPAYVSNSVKSMNNMCNGCSSLSALPVFNYSKINTVVYAFYNCVNVTTGISANYAAVSSKITYTGSQTKAFGNCGINTQQGNAELNLVSSTWK